MGLVYSENVVNLYLMVSGLSSVLPEVFDLSINLASMALWSQWKYSKNYNSHTPFIFFLPGVNILFGPWESVQHKHAGFKFKIGLYNIH